MGETGPRWKDAFSFGSIPGCIAGHEAGPSARVGYTDDELRALPLAAPPPPGAAPWVHRGSITLPLGGAEVAVNRWTRVGAEAQYWVDAAGGGDMFFACGDGDWFLAVWCLGGHPAVCTSELSWAGSHGSTAPPALPCGTADELIAAAAALAHSFVGGRRDPPEDEG